MATKTVSEIGVSNITRLNVHYLNLFHDNYFNNIWFKILPVLDPILNETFLTAITQDSAGNNIFNSNSFITLPCPPYCEKDQKVGIKILLNSGTSGRFNNRETKRSFDDYCQLISVDTDNEIKFGLISVNRSLTGVFEYLTFTDPNQIIVLPE